MDLLGFRVNEKATGRYDLQHTPIGVCLFFTCSSYGYLSGTSQATPHVSGLAALVLSQHPDYTAAQVKNCIVNAANSAGPTVSGQPFHVISAPEAVTCPSRQVQYTFTGVGSGTLGGINFTTAAFNFTVTATSDTVKHTALNGPTFYNTGALSYSIAGVGTGTSTNPVSVFSGDFGHLFVGVMTSTYPSANLVWGAVNSLPIYDLETVHGSVTLSDFFRSQPEPLYTSGGVLSLSSISSLVFQASIK